jgi:hypothetical protein
VYRSYQEITVMVGARAVAVHRDAGCIEDVPILHRHHTPVCRIGHDTAAIASRAAV